MLQSMGSQRVEHYWVTELTELCDTMAVLTNSTM